MTGPSLPDRSLSSPRQSEAARREARALLPVAITNLTGAADYLTTGLQLTDACRLRDIVDELADLRDRLDQRRALDERAVASDDKSQNPKEGA